MSQTLGLETPLCFREAPSSAIVENHRSVQWRLLSHQCSLGHPKIGSLQKTTYIYDLCSITVQPSLNLSSSLTSSTAKSLWIREAISKPDKRSHESLKVLEESKVSWHQGDPIAHTDILYTPLQKSTTNNQADWDACKLSLLSLHKNLRIVCVGHHQVFWSPNTWNHQKPTFTSLPHLHFKTSDATNANFSISYDCDVIQRVHGNFPSLAKSVEMVDLSCC